MLAMRGRYFVGYPLRSQHIIISIMVNKWLIINTLKNSDAITRTLRGLVIHTETICAGNRAVTAKCHLGEDVDELLIKCYMRRNEHSRFLYGCMYYDNELGIYSPSGHVEYIDVALTRWVEGKALSEYIIDKSSDFASLSHYFDVLAYALMHDKMVHYDIKPDNIIVRSDGCMELVDYDAFWSDSLGLSPCRELGTAGYRDVNTTIYTPPMFVMNYPLVIISVMLAALSYDYERVMQRMDDGSFLEPTYERGYKSALRLARKLFVEAGDAEHLALLDAITSSGIVCSDLPEKFYRAAYPRSKYAFGPHYVI